MSNPIMIGHGTSLLGLQAMEKWDRKTVKLK